MANSVDSVYNHTAPGAGTPPPAWAYLRPWASNEERLVQQNLEVQMLPNAEIQAIVRPPLPQIVLFPDRFAPHPPQPDLMDVLDSSRQVKVSDHFSGGPGSYSGSARNVQGQW